MPAACPLCLASSGILCASPQTAAVVGFARPWLRLVPGIPASCRRCRAAAPGTSRSQGRAKPAGCLRRSAENPRAGQASGKLQAFAGLIGQFQEKLLENSLSLPAFIEWVENESGLVQDILDQQDKIRLGESTDRIENLRGNFCLMPLNLPTDCRRSAAAGRLPGWTRRTAAFWPMIWLRPGRVSGTGSALLRNGRGPGKPRLCSAF